MAVVSNDGIYMWNSSDVPVYSESVVNGISTGDQLQDYFSLLGNVASQNNQWSAEQAMKQMEFQERMSNTAHQREMADLKESGLNPILSAKSGATSPSGAMGNFDSGITNAFGEIITKLLDIQNDNAKANLIGSVGKITSGSGSGYYGYSGVTGDNVVAENSDFFKLLLEALGLNPNTAKQVVQQSSNLIEKFGNPIADAYNKASSFLGNIVNSAKTAYNEGKTVITPVVDAVFGSGSASKANTAITNAVNNVVNTVKNTVNNVKTSASNIVNSVKNTVSNAVSNVKNTVSNALKGLFKK